MLKDVYKLLNLYTLEFRHYFLNFSEFQNFRFSDSQILYISPSFRFEQGAPKTY